jgi:predicted exporter
VSAPNIEERLRGQSATFRKYSWPILIVSVALTAGLVVDLAFVDTPSFHTDLADFAPESDSADAHDRINEQFTEETRPLFVHVTRDDGGNVLDIDSLILMNTHLSTVEDESASMGDLVENWITRKRMAPKYLTLNLGKKCSIL